MSFVRIHFFAIMLISVLNGVLGPVEDVSGECEKNETVSYYLSTGFGESDTAVLMVASTKQFICFLVFYVQPKSFINIVIEFPDLEVEDIVCVTEENSVVMVSEFQGQNECEVIKSSGVYAKIKQQNISIQIEAKGNLSTAKVTATALRPVNASICTDTQVHCIIDKDYYCMSAALLCDGNKNCGAKQFFSDEKDCECRPLPLLTIIGSIAMTLTTIWIISSILENIFPERGRTFIYRIDEEMSSYDAQYSNLQIEVTVLVVFPSELGKNLTGSRRNTSSL